MVDKYELYDSGGLETLYHVSDSIVAFPTWNYAEKVKGENIARLRDFGLGFYTCKDDYDYSLKIASGKDIMVLNKYNVHLSGLKCIELAINLEWLLVVAFHRRDFMSHGRRWLLSLRDRCRDWVRGCDLVIGPISDDRTYSVVEMYVDNLITDETAIKMLNVTNYGYQYVFKSELACSRLTNGFSGSSTYELGEIIKIREEFFKEKVDFGETVDKIRVDRIQGGEGLTFTNLLESGEFDARVRF